MSIDLGNVAVWLALFLAGYGLGHFSASSASSRASRAAWKPDPSITDAAIEAELRAGRKIEAIKLYRQRDGSGLKEAKQAVESMNTASTDRRQR